MICGGQNICIFNKIFVSINLQYLDIGQYEKRRRTFIGKISFVHFIHFIIAVISFLEIDTFRFHNLTVSVVQQMEDNFVYNHVQAA